MGNAALRKVPEDLTKCSDSQLKFMINSVIINNPWNDEGEESDEDALQSTIEVMRQKGFRPITPTEYVQELKRQRKEPQKCPQGVKVWLPMSSCVRIMSDVAVAKNESNFDSEYKHSYSTTSTPHTTNSAKLSIRCSDSKDSAASIEDLTLPSSREGAAREILRSGASAAEVSELTGENAGDITDSEDLVTEEWPTHGPKSNYNPKQGMQIYFN